MFEFKKSKAMVAAGAVCDVDARVAERLPGGAALYTRPRLRP